MSDLISRQAAIDEINKLTYPSSLTDVKYVLTKLPSAEPRWIPVTERLPKEPFGCLVTVWDTDLRTYEDFENLLPYFVGWDGEQWNDADGDQCPFEVIAWMPLPEPYKGGAE